MFPIIEARIKLLQPGNSARLQYFMGVNNTSQAVRCTHKDGHHWWCQNQIPDVQARSRSCLQLGTCRLLWPSATLQIYYYLQVFLTCTKSSLIQMQMFYRMLVFTSKIFVNSTLKTFHWIEAIFLLVQLLQSEFSTIQNNHSLMIVSLQQIQNH